MSNGHRWSKWWWQDHRNDPAVRMCRLAARALWIEMLGLMFEADGYLLVNGKQPSTHQLAMLVGAMEREVVPLLVELEDAGVFSRAEDGTIYSRRMVRDAEASAQAKAWGSRGGNPKLNPKPNGGVNPPHNPQDNAHLKRRDKPKILEAEERIRGETCESTGEVPREARRSLTTIPPEWKPNGQSKAKALNLGLNPGEIDLTADQMRAWAKAGDHRKADWDAMFDRFVLQEFSHRAAERRRVRQPSASAEIRAAVGTLLTVQLDDEEELPGSSKALIQ